METIAVCAKCGIPVPEPGVFFFAYEGETYDFCSEKCRTDFMLDPERYLHEEDEREE